MKVLVSGGVGYVGGCVCAALENRGHVPVVVDHLRACQSVRTQAGRSRLSPRSQR